MKTAQEFINERQGRGVDVDGAYGYQCWDLFAYFCQQAGYPVFNCNTSGYVKDIYNNRKSSGILNYFEDVAVMQKGDWCIWGNCAACPDSHIAMFVSDNNNGTGQFLGQNQLTNDQRACIITLPYAGNLGALRPKCYVQAASTPITHKIGYKVHMYDIGWGPMVYDGAIAGTTGESRRIEALMIDPMGMAITAKAHLEDIGWKDYGTITKDTVIGTTGESRRLEALCLKGNFEYRVHIADEGWSAWTQADGIASLGTVGMKHAIEAIEIRSL